MEVYRSLAGCKGLFSILAMFSGVVLIGLTMMAPADLWAGPPELEKAKGEQCVRDSGWMRRNHMDFLKHKREITVREGVRVRSESLRACAGCHTGREGFCDRCHDYVAVAPDCFQCHNYPE